MAAIGVLHTPGGRRAMAQLGIPCPVDKVTAQQVTAARHAGLRRLRGDRPAPARPALGMGLGRFTAADVQQWQRREGVHCDAITRGFTYLRCRGVAAQALGVAGPAISEVWFSFDAQGRLVGVDSYRRGLDDGGAKLAWSDAESRLERVLGAPSSKLGEASPAVLRASPLQTARVEFRYRDYVAVLTAVNLPHAGLAVREQYMLAQ
jgi:hypothetical protein